MNKRAIRHVIVRGRVQGVGYRAFVEHEALKCGIEGWVRNRHDGTVEAVFAGAREKVDAIVEACRRAPRAAQVEQIDQREGTDSIWRSAAPENYFRCCPHRSRSRRIASSNSCRSTMSTSGHRRTECRDRRGW